MFTFPKRNCCNAAAPKQPQLGKIGVYGSVSKKGRNLLRRPQPRCGFRTGRDTSRTDRPTVIAAAITSQREKTKLPTHIELNADKCGLQKDSIVLLEQIRTIDKKRLKERMGELDPTAMTRVNSALSISFGLHNDAT